MKISLYTSPFTYTRSYYEVVDVAVKYGIKYVETITDRELEEPNVEFAKDLYKYAKERGISFSCVSVYAKVAIESYEEDVARLKGFVDVAEALHSPYIHHTIVPGNFTPDEEEGLFQNGVKAVREVIEYAKSKGITALYEPQGLLFNGVEKIEKLMSLVDAGIVADFGYVFFVDERITPIIERCPDKIMNVHLKDYKLIEDAPEYHTSKFGTRFVDCQLGDGDVDFDTPFELLRKIGYDGCVALECFPTPENEEEGFLHNLEFMKKLGCE